MSGGRGTPNKREKIYRTEAKEMLNFIKFRYTIGTSETNSAHSLFNLTVFSVGTSPFSQKGPWESGKCYKIFCYVHSLFRIRY